MDDAPAHWAQLELAAWRGITFDRDLHDRTLRDLVRRTPSLFLFEICNGRVTLIDKDAAAIPAADAGEDALFRTRAALYAAFIQSVIDVHRIAGDARFVIGVHDRSTERFPVPTFAFQKQRASDAILLPDVDLLHLGFLEDELYQDPIPFADKIDEAVFAGSTTGGVITAELVARGTHPRLDAAAFFKGRHGVSFTLPEIVQCDEPGTVELVRQLEVGGARRSWHDQLSYKYLLSMDGNGAACSRVALALGSNGVLVKYNSPHLLYYFRGLEPWRDYIPVRRHSDVLDLIDRAPSTRARDLAIAKRSRLFANDHLNRAAVMRYTARLLNEYIELFGTARPGRSLR